MSATTTTTLLIFGFMMGVQIMVFAFMMVVPAVVKIPGAHGTHYLNGGFAVQVASLLLYGEVRKTNLLSMQMLVLTGLLTGYLLIWAGDRYFRLQRPGNAMWLIAGAALLTFACLGFIGLSPDMVALYFSTCAVMFWVFTAFKIFENRPVQFTLATYLLIGGAALMAANSLLRAAMTSGLFPWLASHVADNSSLGLRFIGAMLGGVTISAAYVLLYFERVVQESNHAATHDELTGLLNRRAIVSNGEREIELARRSRQPLAVAFVDIDFFKKINDGYGHDIGDLALREVALVLQKNCRSIDLIGRYGGEEFCMILPGDDHAGAQSVGERLLTAVREHQIDGLPPVTISIGLAVLDLDDPAQTWHSLISLADEELYRAKHAGRNRCAIGPEKGAADDAQMCLPSQKIA